MRKRTGLAESKPLSAKQQQKLQKRLQKREKKQRAKALRQQKKKLDKSPAAAEKLVKRSRSPQKAADCLQFDYMYENGLCQIEPGVYSLTLRFSDINYQIAKRDEQANIFTRYCELLNYCDPGMHLQINLVTRHLDQERFEADMYIPLLSDGLDRYRREMNKIIADKAMEGQNGLVRDKYMTISVATDSYEDAMLQLTRRASDLKSNLKGLHSTAEVLSGRERLQLMAATVRPDGYHFAYDWLLAEPTLTAKDFLAPSAYDWKPEHDDTRAVYNDRYRFGDRLGKTVYLRDIAPEMTDDLLSRLSELPFDLTIAVHIDAIEQHDAVELVKTKLAYMHQEETDAMMKAVQQKLPAAMGVRYELTESITSAGKLLDDLTSRNQKLFRVCIMVHTSAETNQELDSRIKQIYSTVEKKTCKFDALLFEQREAMNSILPIGKKRIAIERTMTTANTAIFIPFTTCELFQTGGLYEGLNARSKNLIMFRRKDLSSPAGFVLGQPGSGKSMAVKREITGIRLWWPEDDIIIIDPEGEYTPLIQNLGGQVIEISSSSREHINPMDITEDYADDDNPLVLKSQFLQTFCELITGGVGITASERTYIDRATRLTYSHFFAHPDKMEMPGLQDFYANLVKQGEGAANIATALSIYVDGTMDIFAHQTNVDITNSLVAYNTVKLGKPLQTLGMMVVLDQIWNRVTLNRAKGRRTWIYTDEFQLLLRDHECTNYYFEISGRARKWGAILTSITQHVDSVLLNEDSRRMLSDCQYIKLLNQAPLDAQALGKQLKISPEELTYVTNVDAGCGLLIAGRTVVPFVDDFPSNTELFKLMDTNPNTAKAMPRM